MKRWLYAAAFVVAAVAATGAGAPPAQGIERPAARPTLSITVTDGGIWTWPALEAGSYRVTIDNLTERPADLLFVRVPEGWSAERYAAADAWELDAARLFGEGGSGETSREVAGRVSAPPHSTGRGEVALRPGTWLLTPAGASPGADYAVIAIETGR